MSILWINVVDGVEIRCVKSSVSNKPFKYELKKSDDVNVIDATSNSPVELTYRSQVYSEIKKYLTDYSSEKQNEIFIQIKNELEKNIVDEDKIAVLERENQLREEQNRLNEKYTNLYAQFKAFLEKYDMSALELIVSVSHCLGVKSAREIVRAFLGYFETISGFKGTNVIAIGNASSGKSFVLETALSMIPDENIHKGGKSVAYFFRKYNGMDLTGEVFYLGDLGGEKSNEDTIQLRDLIKELTTDGRIERGVVNKDNNMEEEEQVITGYPALSYTSAREELINDQEKSRSVILTPQPVDSALLMVYNTVVNNHGMYYDDFNEIDAVRESIKGLVYKLDLGEFDFFNGYQFVVQELVKDNDDFNRKIQEFDAILKLVTILNHPYSLTHNLYYDEMYDKKETKIFLASKRDVINALNIFDSANLLPNEILFANGLLKEYNSFNNILKDEEKLWEDEVYDSLISDGAVDPDNGFIDISFHQDKLFTLKSLKTTHRGKVWFKKSKNYLNERIKTLLDESIIVNIGKDVKNKHNVYCINYGVGSSVEDTIPNFKASHINKATKLFEQLYPENIDEYKEFLANDNEYDFASIFETVKPLKPNLPFLDDSYGV